MRFLRPSSAKAPSMKRRLLTNQTAYRSIPYNSILSTERYTNETFRNNAYRSMDGTRLFSSSVDTKSSSSSSHQKKKKRSRRSNLQRTQTPKQLSYKGSSQDNRTKSTTKSRRGSNRKSKQNSNKQQHSKYDNNATYPPIISRI